MITKTLTQPPTELPTMPITEFRTRDDLIDEGVRRFFAELSRLGILAEDLGVEELLGLIDQSARSVIPLGRSLGREALFEALEDLHDILVVLVQEEQEKAGKLSRMSHDEFWAEVWAEEGVSV
jgi:hypothetical protein